MPDLHKAMTEEDVKKIFWCAKAAKYLEEQGWEFQQAFEYAEILHYDYVVLGGQECDPVETVQEDMAYWD